MTKLMYTFQFKDRIGMSQMLGNKLTNSYYFND